MWKKLWCEKDWEEFLQGLAVTRNIFFHCCDSERLWFGVARLHCPLSPRLDKWATEESLSDISIKILAEKVAIVSCPFKHKVSLCTLIGLLYFQSSAYPRFKVWFKVSLKLFSVWNSNCSANLYRGCSAYPGTQHNWVALQCFLWQYSSIKSLRILVRETYCNLD